MSRAWAALPLALLAACGGQSAEDEIRGILDERQKSPASICDHMTAELLASLGGAEQCRQLARAPDNQAPDARIDEVVVDGDRATVRVADQDGLGTLRFRRVDGEWRLAEGG